MRTLASSAEPSGEERSALLVLGLGNLLCGDDAAGILALRQLEARYGGTPHVRFVDGGTLGLMLVPALREAERLLIVDAVQDSRPAGSIVRIHGDALIASFVRRVSVHDIGVEDILAGNHWLGGGPTHVELVGVVVDNVEWGYGLTDVVSRALDPLCEEVAASAARWGVPLIGGSTTTADRAGAGRVDPRPSDDALARPALAANDEPGLLGVGFGRL